MCSNMCASETRDAVDLVGRADVDVGEEGDHRGRLALVDHQRQAVVERLDGQVLLELLDALRVCG